MRVVAYPSEDHNLLCQLEISSQSSFSARRAAGKPDIDLKAGWKLAATTPDLEEVCVLAKEREDRFAELEEHFAGYTVYDANRENIGKVDDLFVDEDDNPEY